MEKLILVRHGDYVISGALTAYGRTQMQELAPALAYSVVGNILLVSSPIQRAKESAAILAEHFRVPVMEHEVWTAPDDWSDNDGALQFIGDIGANIDTLVVVTHLPFLESFPAYFGTKALNVSLPYGGVKKGQAQIIDCETKTMTHVTSTSIEKGLKVTMKESSPILVTPPTSRIHGNYTREHAERYAAILKQAAPKSRLKKVYLFGSIAKYDSGNDVDLVLEVPRKVFLEFASACVGALDGFHPVTAGLLPWASAYWDYESPREVRAKYALNVLSLLPNAGDRLAGIVPYEKVDILCLPTDWRSRADVNQILHKAFGLGKDPNLLRHIIDSAIELH